MKTDSGNRRLLALIGGLAVIALLINFLFFRQAANRKAVKAQEQQEKTEAALNEQNIKDTAAKLKEEKDKAEKAAAEKKAALEKAQIEAAQEAEAEHQRVLKEATEQHTQYLARYLSPNFEQKAGAASVAVVVASEDGLANLELANALARRFQTNDVRLLSAFFTPAFAADGLVAQIFRGQTDCFEKLELTNTLDAVLVGRQMADYSSNPALENSITADLQLEIMALPVRANEAAKSWKFVAKGVGFTRHEARMSAEERIINQIASDTKISLAQTLPPKR